MPWITELREIAEKAEALAAILIQPMSRHG